MSITLRSTAPRRSLRPCTGKVCPFTVERDDDPAQRQQETLTRLARGLLREGADLVFLLDADEFLRIHQPALLARGLAEVPAGIHFGLEWQTYVPQRWLVRGLHPLAIATHRRARERHGFCKMAVTRWFLSEPDTTIIGPSNHAVLRMPDMSVLPFARLAAEVAAIAHLPARSAGQLVAEVRTGWAAHQRAHRDNPNLAFHWRELDEAFTLDGPPAAERLATIAANYGLQRKDWVDAREIALVEDPLPICELRYQDLAQRD